MSYKYRSVWMVLSSLGLAGLLVLGAGLSLALAYSGHLTRVTVASASNKQSDSPSMSADGSRITFVSTSDFLGQGIPAFQGEIWLYDTTTMTFTRVTSSTSFKNLPKISADGAKIAFYSDADFFDQGIPIFQYEIWLYDTATLTLTRITTASAAGRVSAAPTLNADGSKIAFYSKSDFLGQGVTMTEIWLYDTATMTVTRVTYTGGLGTLSVLSLNADGSKLAFSSDFDFLGQGIPSGQYEIWLYDTATMTVTRVTAASASNRGSINPNLSSDGLKLAFSSDSDFFSQSIPNDQNEIWLYNTATMAVTRITTASAGNRGSFGPSLSSDGSRIAFTSDSDFLSQSIPNDQNEIWLYDTDTMTVTRLTNASASDRRSSSANLSANGLVIAFTSDSDFLGQSIPAFQNEIWLIRAAVYVPIIVK